MRTLWLVSSLVAASLTTVSVAPATAAGGDDLLFPANQASNLTERAAHQPYWALLAECAGVFGAASNFETARGNARAAQADKDVGTSMMVDARDQLVADHGITEDDALAFAGDELNVGRQQGAELLSGGDRGAASPWNIKSSACLDIQDVYHHDRHRRRR